MTGLAQLSAVIASSLAEWDVPHVELAIFGAAEPAQIAEQLRRVCRFEMHSTPTRALFYRSSVGAAAGLELENGERVVVKAHQPTTTREHLAEVVRLQRRAELKLRLAPKVLAGPVPFGLGFATIEEFVERGVIRDGHDPVTRSGLARSLHAIVECLSTEYAASTLRTGFMFDQAGEGLWPKPHSKLFDFEATIDGAGYIDEFAARARARMNPAGRGVIGHSDWRAEHVRFEDRSPTIAYDWDSLCKAREPALVGAAAHMFCSDWSREGHLQAPTLAEARAFVGDYEAARREPFDPDERGFCAATFAYAVAYTCRCGHAAGVDARHVPGNFQHLLVNEGEDLFRL